VSVVSGDCTKPRKIKVKDGGFRFCLGFELWWIYEVGVIVNKVADFLRQRRFNAHTGPAVGGHVNHIPVAIDAGLGISGKNGLLITRHSGPRVRLVAVYTDIENLPFAQENLHGWLRDYC
jgi:hypothetical protein